MKFEMSSKFLDGMKGNYLEAGRRLLLSEGYYNNVRVQGGRYLYMH